MDRSKVRRLAELARLHLTDPELERFGHELSQILTHFATLSGVDTEGVPPFAHASLEAELADDQPWPGLTREDIAGMAGSRFAADGGLFVLQGVFGDTDR